MRFNYLQLLGLYLELLHNIKTGMKTLYKRPTTTDNNQFTKFLQTTSTLHLLKHLLKVCSFLNVWSYYNTDSTLV